MAGGSRVGARELNETPTWAVALVCAVIVIISIFLEKVLHSIGETFARRRKAALVEALEKIKGELMVLGFISLILTFGQNYIVQICIPLTLANTMLPCPKKSSYSHPVEGQHRRLLWYEHRRLAADSPSHGCKEGHVPLISLNGLHQLHIFIFFLAVFHVIYSAFTMKLGRMKIRGWKEWENEAAEESEALNDPTRLRLTHQTSFVKGNSNWWTSNACLFYSASFIFQFVRAVRKADYMTLRHGFIFVHLAPGSKFNFQKYIKRSLEDDFKVVVGISPLLWTSAVLFLLLNVHGSHIMLLLSIFPLVTTLAIGTKLQAIIVNMASEIQEKHAVVQGIPLVNISDKHFWFGRPRWILHMIHLMLFLNAFEITNFFWILYEFGSESCFYESFTVAIVRICLGFGLQFVVSYFTLPLYALVTQMGTTMKKSIFDEQTSKALMKWHKHAKKNCTSRSNKMQSRTLGQVLDEVDELDDDSPIGSPRLSTSSSIDIDIAVKNTEVP